MDCNFNRVRLCGRISSDPALSHVNHGETFYRFVLSVQRLSGQCDDLPVIVPRQLLRACPLGRGDAAAVTGQLRSFNNRSGQGRRLIISVFAQTLERGSGVPCNRIQLGVAVQAPELPPYAARARDLRPDPRGEPALWTGGLSAVHRVGRCGAADALAHRRRAAVSRGAGAKPRLYEKSRYIRRGAHGL